MRKILFRDLLVDHYLIPGAQNDTSKILAVMENKKTISVPWAMLLLQYTTQHSRVTRVTPILLLVFVNDNFDRYAKCEQPNQMCRFFFFLVECFVV